MKSLEKPNRIVAIQGKMMKRLNENILEEDGIRIEFVGWTRYDNQNFSEIFDEIHKNLIEDKSEPILSYIPKSGKEEYVRILRRANYLAELLLINRLFIKGIKFDGSYHQDGNFGCPLFKVNEIGTFKWSCSFRAWGDVMEHTGYGLSYCDWAWDNPEKPVTPDMVEDKSFLISENL